MAEIKAKLRVQNFDIVMEGEIVGKDGDAASTVIKTLCAESLQGTLDCNWLFRPWWDLKDYLVVDASDPAEYLGPGVRRTFRLFCHPEMLPYVKAGDLILDGLPIRIDGEWKARDPDSVLDGFVLAPQTNLGIEQLPVTARLSISSATTR